MVLTDDLGLAEAIVDLRDNGKLEGHHFPGTNSKMSEVDCAQMLVKLKHFDKWQARRKAIAEYYIGELNEFVDIALPGPDVESAWHKFVIRLTNRHALKHHLSLCGIETKIHYEKPLFELPIGYDFIDYARDPFREASAFSRECLSLPIHPELTDSEVTQVIERIEEFLR
jgi:dTDP-4-amino-4,6-dideoxygalactose transaminase